MLLFECCNRHYHHDDCHYAQNSDTDSMCDIFRNLEALDITLHAINLACDVPSCVALCFKMEFEQRVTVIISLVFKNNCSPRVQYGHPLGDLQRTISRIGSYPGWKKLLFFEAIFCSQRTKRRCLRTKICISKDHLQSHENRMCKIVLIDFRISVFAVSKRFEKLYT